MENETLLRLGFFISALLALLLFEKIFPRRKLIIPKKYRWGRNYLLILIDSIFVRVLLPFTLAGISIYAADNCIGLFNYFSVDIVIASIISFIRPLHKSLKGLFNVYCVCF